MGKKGIIIAMVSLGVVGGAIYGGIKAYQNYQDNSLEADVEAISNINQFYFGQDMTSVGTVKNDFSQSVYLLEDKNVSEVYVEEGQKVSEGELQICRKNRSQERNCQERIENYLVSYLVKWSL